MDVGAALLVTVAAAVVGLLVGPDARSVEAAADASSSANNTLNAYVRELLTHFSDDEEQRDVVLHLRSPTALLHCTVTVSPGDKEINVEWYRDGARVQNKTGSWISPDGTLHLDDDAALGPDALEGAYECHVRHRAGVVAGHRTHLRAPKSPEFSQHPQDAVAYLGDSVRLECVASGSPDPAVVWLKDDQSVNVSVARIYAFSGVLQITKLTAQDEGSYECRAMNLAGQGRSQPARLTIQSPSANRQTAPKLVFGPRDQTAVASDRVVLECLVMGTPQPIVTWMRKDGATYQSSGQTQVTRLGNLEIRSVQLSDAGVYVCSWSDADSSGRNSSAQARLTVLAPPRLFPGGGMEWLTLRRRRQVVRLACDFSGAPLPAIVWLKNGRVVEPNGRMRTEDLELIISSSETSDSGFYQCRGENGVGAAQSVTWVYVERNGNAPLPPVGLVAVPLSSTSVRLTWSDHPLSWNQSIIAYSIHSFLTEGSFLYLRENQKVLKKTEDSSTPEMTIDGLDPFTNYTLFVVAYNVEDGSDYSSFVTVVTGEEVPSDSPLIEVVALGANALRVRWSELGRGVARGTVLGYKILHCLHGNVSCQQNAVGAEDQEFIIQGLRPETEHDVTVVAATGVGFSPLEYASWLTVATEALGRTGVPDCLAMNVSLLNSCDLLVTWQSRKTSEKISGFKLTNQKALQRPLAADDGHSNPVKVVVNLDAGADKYIFTQLEVPGVYQVDLALESESDEGCGIAKTFSIDSLSSDVSAGNLPVPPTKISARAVNSSAIAVQWERPPSADPITRYTVRCHPDGLEAADARSVTSAVKLVTSPKETIVIGGLMAHTLYDLSVQTHTSDAIGRFSSAVVKCRTDEGVPSEPLNIRLTLYSSTAVQVSWDPPAWRNGVVQSYVIYYSDDGSKALSEWLTKTSGAFPAASLSSLVTHLFPNTVYHFRLAAATFVGVGPLSEIVHIQTQKSSAVQASQEVTKEPPAGTFSDLDLGIIIGTAIGVTCIVLCVIVIVVRDRRCAPTPVPAVRNHVANGAVKSCRCHLGNCSGPELQREPWPGPDPGDDGDEFPSVNSVLVENEHCDTKGGSKQGGSNARIPLHVFAHDRRATPQDNRHHLSDIHDDQPYVPTSVEDQPVDDAQDGVPDGFAGATTSPDERPRGRSISMQPPSHVAPVPSKYATDGEPASNKQPDRQANGERGNEERGNEIELHDDSFRNCDRASEQTESLLGNSCRADCNHHSSRSNARAVDDESVRC